MENENIFKTGFDSYVCPGDCITAEHSGFTLVARLEHDQDAHIDNDDTHNTDLRVTGCDAARQEKLLAARKAWFNGKWFYGGIVVSVSFRGVELVSASLWAIDCNYPGSDNAYLLEVANELALEAIAEAEKVLAILRGERGGQ